MVIDGVEYVEKSKIQHKLIEPKEGEQYCMVRTYSAGVYCGWIDPTKTKDRRNTVREAKRIFYWENAATLSELAMKGTSAPQKCKVPMPVDIEYLEEIIATTPMTEEAIDSINKIPIWTEY